MRIRTLCILLFFVLLGALVTAIFYRTQQANINFQLAHRLFIHGKHTEAIPYYEKSLAIDPEGLKCQKELAYSYLWTERSKEAIALFTKIIAQHPDDYATAFSLAQAYSWAGEYDQAIQLMKEIIAKTGDFMVQMQLAEIYIWANRSKDAVTLLEQMTKKYPDNVEVELLLGKALYYTGESKKASEVFEQILYKQKKKT